ncbi:YjiH family protein [Vreelandella sp. GE22]
MSESQTTRDEAASNGPIPRSHLLKFLIPSVVGVLLFLVPFQTGESVNIGMGMMADGLQALLGQALPLIAMLVLCVSVVVTLYVKTTNPAWARGGHFGDMFNVGPIWVALRILGAVFVVMTYFQVGPEFVTASFTGGVMLDDLAPVLLTFFFFAAILLPFLVEFGFMEFIGSLVRKPFRIIFNLPGRSAIDATASWMGSGTVGVLITSQQYEQGFYNGREASVIATNFSVASIAFSLLVANFVGINHLFVPFYFTVVVSGLVAAIIVSRIPPLSLKANDYYAPVGCQISEENTGKAGLFRYSLLQATRRAAGAPGPVALAKLALINVIDIFLTLLPLVFAIGTVALILAEFTPLFTWLSYPMVPVLELLRIPEAQAAAPATLVGFADMFLPAVLATNIDSELTRFVIACLSMTQLVYMSEIGALLLKSKIPIALWELAVVFLLRTAITLPIIAFMAHTFFF